MSFNSLQDQLDNVLQEAQQHTHGIEQYAKNHVTDNPDDVERELTKRLENFRSRINEQLSDVEKSITKNAPKPNDPDYECKKARYKEFLADTTSAIKKMAEMLGNLLSKLAAAIHQIVQWIIQNLPAIVSAIVILFERVIFPLMKAKQNNSPNCSMDNTKSTGNSICYCNLIRARNISVDES